MNVAWLGAKYLLSDRNSDHAVVPTRPGSSRSRHSKADHSAPSLTATPSFSRYQTLSAFGSRALKKTPPILITRSAGSPGDSCFCAATNRPPPKPATKVAAMRLALTETPSDSLAFVEHLSSPCSAA